MVPHLAKCIHLSLVLPSEKTSRSFKSRPILYFEKIFYILNILNKSTSLIHITSPASGVVCGVWRRTVPELDSEQQPTKTGHLCFKPREAVLDNRGSSERRWGGNAERSTRISNQWANKPFFYESCDITIVMEGFPLKCVCFVFRPTEDWLISAGPLRGSDSASGPALDWWYWRPLVVHFNDSSCLSVQAPWQDRAPHPKTWKVKRWALIQLLIEPLFTDRQSYIFDFFPPLTIGLSKLVGEDLIIKHR